MMFKKDDDSLVHINDISEVKLHKIKPADLAKRYIDKNGQEYKLKYDPFKKKVVIIKIIKSVLNGSYMKNKFDQTIAPDKKIETEFKYKMGELGSQFLKDKYHLQEILNDDEPAGHDAVPPSSSEEEKMPKVMASDGAILSIEDAFKSFNRIKERLDAAIKNIYDSNVLNERYSYDDKMLLDDIVMMIKQNILEEMKNTKIKYEDVLKGYEDTNISAKLYSDQVKQKLGTILPDNKLTFLRDLRGVDIYIQSLERILKNYNDLDYKISTIPDDKINARTYMERQKLSDAKVSINTCRSDTRSLLDFFKRHKDKMIQ